jgi:hypothetical protein
VNAVDPQVECTHDTEARVKAATNGGLCPVCLDNTLRESLLRLSILQATPKALQVQLLKHEVEMLWKVIELMTRPG